MNPKPKPGSNRRAQQARTKARKDAWYRPGGRDYAAYIRSRPCVIADRHACAGRVEAASLKKSNHRAPGESGVGHIVPLCTQAHAEQEGATEWFELEYGIDLAPIAQRLGEIGEMTCL